MVSLALDRLSQSAAEERPPGRQAEWGRFESISRRENPEVGVVKCLGLRFDKP